MCDLLLVIVVKDLFYYLFLTLITILNILNLIPQASTVKRVILEGVNFDY